MNLLTIRLVLLSALVALLSENRLSAQEPQWTSRVLKVGADRQKTNSVSIFQRPYRPLHFYGNSVRRLHYRGRAIPMPRDMANTVRYITVRQ